MLREIGLVIGVVALVVALLVGYVLLVQWAWNTFVPVVFDGPTIEIPQAVVLALLLTVFSGGTRYVRDR